MLSFGNSEKAHFILFKVNSNLEIYEGGTCIEPPLTIHIELELEVMHLIHKNELQELGPLSFSIQEL